MHRHSSDTIQSKKFWIKNKNSRKSVNGRALASANKIIKIRYQTRTRKVWNRRNQVDYLVDVGVRRCLHWPERERQSSAIVEKFWTGTVYVFQVVSAQSHQQCTIIRRRILFEKLETNWRRTRVIYTENTICFGVRNNIATIEAIKFKITRCSHTNTAANWCKWATK